MTADTRRTALYLLEAAVSDAQQALRTAEIIVQYNQMPDHLTTAVRDLHTAAATVTQSIAATLNRTEA